MRPLQALRKMVPLQERKMAIIGSHMLIYTTEAEALRATLRDVFNLKSVDAGGGWLIFKMPPAELGIHPTDGSVSNRPANFHVISFMCDDINETVAELRAKGVRVLGEPTNAGFGVTVNVGLPGGVEVMIYQPRHKAALDL